MAWSNAKRGFGKQHRVPVRGPLAIPLAVGVATTVGGALLTKALAPKPQAAPAMQPTPQVRSNSQVADVLSARRGSRDNQRTGARGAEASGGMKTKLGN